MLGESKRRSAPISAMHKRRLLERLELLCTCGAGMEAIAPAICAIFRELGGADSGSVFWLDEAGIAGGFFHDCAPVEINDFFISHFDEFFSNPDEVNMVGMLRPIPPHIGKALDPDYYARFRASNVYKYLCAPLGHEYLLDIRVDVDGIGRALFCGWRGEGHPFSARDAKAVEPVCAFAHQAFISARDTVAWQSIGSRTAHFITDASGTRLIGIDDEAEALLRAGHLLRQNISLQDDQRAAPSFARALSAQLECGLTAEITLPVATGRLAMKAVRSNIRTHQNEAIQMMVTVDLQQAIDVSVIELLSTLPLTMLQKKIALFAAQGELRRNCEVRFDVSPEALKKHLNAIYLATDTQSWGELASLAIKVN